MATKRRTSLLIDEVLLRKARKALHAPTNSETVTRALEEAVANKDIEMSLKGLLRGGRGRLVDVYREAE